MRALGLMSGTSLDGIDCAILDTDGEAIHAFGPAATYPYTDAQRATIRAAFGATQYSDVTADADRVVTDGHVDAVARFVAEHDIDPSRIDVIGFHGQTITHQPRRGFTWQLGASKILADETRRPVVAGLRWDDMEAGGQGAPLVPVYHRALTAGLPRPVAVLNIGGVANVTWIGVDGSLVAFDTGPGNAPLDDWIRRHTGEHCDLDGKHALAGTPSEGFTADFLLDRYFGKEPPKSLDRNYFHINPPGDASIEDGAAIIVDCIAGAVSLSTLYFPAPPATWIVCGGGARNPAILAALRRYLEVPVRAADELGWNSDAIEAQAFAFLAVRHLFGLPITWPGTTGVRKPTTGGQLYMPRGTRP